jgi:S-methylmethionine-dependent homocysteine/selenocysteine methylase
MTPDSAVTSTDASTDVGYERVRRMIARDECVILDGAMGSELIKVRGSDPAESEHLWGLTALFDAPDDVANVHRRYIDVGCDVVCTNTWGLATALRDGGTRFTEGSEPVHWMDLARRAVALARDAARSAGREDEVAIAFSLNGDIDTSDGRETIRLLSRSFA